MRSPHALAASAALIVLLAFPQLAQSAPLAVHRDVLFATAGAGTPLTADIWHRSKPAKGRPIAVLVHGGGWATGDKRQWEERRWSQRLAQRGYLVVAINYRLACGEKRGQSTNATEAAGAGAPTPENAASIRAIRPSDSRLCGYGMDESVMDVRAGVRYASKRGARWGGDPRRIVIYGISAGAHLALLAGSDVDRPKGVRAIVALSPPADLTWIGERPELAVNGSLTHAFGCAYAQCPDRWRAFSPRERVTTATFPPVYTFNSAADIITPAVPAKAFVRELKKHGEDAQFTTSSNPNETCHGPAPCAGIRLRGSRFGIFDDVQRWLVRRLQVRRTR